MVCKNCGRELMEGDKFCPHCGAEVEQKIMYCTNCGNPIDLSNEYCMKCGVKIGRNRRRISKNVGFTEAYKLYWKNAFDFSGRANLAEFWFVMVWDMIIGMGMAILFIVLSLGAVTSASGPGEGWMIVGFGIIALIVVAAIWSLVNLIPAISLTVRRLHDSDKSGLFVLLIFLWGIGSIILLVLMCLPSDPHENRYG